MTPSLDHVLRLFENAGCRRVFTKFLAENDNSKNQVYLGQDFSALNLIPNQGIEPSPTNNTLKAKLSLQWLREDGTSAPAPGAQLVLYPQYPEVRLSGFLRGCRGGPNAVMAHREHGRVLFLGIAGQTVYGFATWVTPALGQAIRARTSAVFGVFTELHIAGAGTASRDELLAQLKSIHEKGWIRSHRLNSDGTTGPCEAPNCGGLTLEAELGITPNGYSDPDYRGWEIKQHQVPSFERFGSGAITLMTPEPSGGVYAVSGVEVFIRRFGYADRLGRPDRLNFGGVHRAGKMCPATGLTLTLDGFDPDRRAITNSAGGGITLLTPEGDVAARWPYPQLLQHWQKKHALAAFVPAVVRSSPEREYAYGHTIRLGEGTDFLLFLSAVAEGRVYYDPGIKLEGQRSSKPKIKRRSQFRIKSSDLEALYFVMRAYRV